MWPWMVNRRAVGEDMTMVFENLTEKSVRECILCPHHLPEASIKCITCVTNSNRTHDSSFEWRETEFTRPISNVLPLYQKDPGSKGKDVWKKLAQISVMANKENYIPQWSSSPVSRNKVWKILGSLCLSIFIWQVHWIRQFTLRPYCFVSLY